MRLTGTVLKAVKNGDVVFEDDLPNPRFCLIGQLQFVRPMVGSSRWHLVVGAGYTSLRIGWIENLVLECYRFGWERRNKK